MYFVREIGTDNMFLRARNKLCPLKEADPDNIAVRRLEHFSIEVEAVSLPSILIKEGARKMKRRRGVSFDGTCHVNHTCLLVGTHNL